MKLTPNRGCVFIQHVEPAEMRGHIVLPDTMSTENRNGGKIVAIGEPQLDKRGQPLPIDVKIGQYALFRPNTGDVFKVGKATFFSVHLPDLIAITEDEEEFQQLST